MITDKDTFTKQIVEGWTVKELQAYYGLSRSQIYAYKKKWDLSGLTPNSKQRCHDTGVKVCNSCKEELTLDNFHSNGYYPSGSKKYKGTCKLCAKNQTRLGRKEKIRNILESLDRKLECERCGYNKNAAALCFHHLNPEEKDFTIAGLTTSASVEKLTNEIAKCALLCHNCHMEEHYPHLQI